MIAALLGIRRRRRRSILDRMTTDIRVVVLMVCVALAAYAVLWLREQGLLVWTVRLAILLLAGWLLIVISTAVMTWIVAIRKFLGIAPGKAGSMRVNENDSFHRSQEWRQLRSLFWQVADYATDNDPRCMYCGAHCDRGSREDSHVDHIKPQSKRPDLALDIRNLGPSCATCNRSKSDSIWSGYSVDQRIARAAEIVHANGNRMPRHWRRRQIEEN